MEVIFAIGVILTGLVGIAALIPVAANNARATLELDRGVSESTSAAAVGVAQSFLDFDSLVIFDKPASESEAYAAGTYDYVPSNAMRTLDWKLNVQTNGHPPEGSTTGPFFQYGKLESPGYGHMDLGSGLSAGICIDPIGMPNANLTSPQPFAQVQETDTAFDYSRFPYFGERYQVLRAPNLPINNQPQPSGVTPLWPMSPRMWRATVKLPMYVSPAVVPVQQHQLMSAAAIRRVFSGSGGITGLGTDTPEDPNSLLVSPTNIGGQSIDASTQNSSKYTWFITLAPPFSGGTTFRQSIVVVRQRTAPVPQRPNDPLALQKNAYTAEDEEDNPAAERLTWVGDAIGFSGGAGGEVQLYGSQGVSDEINSGEWVMFSRQPHAFNPAVNRWVPDGPAVHRWYRVLRVGETEEIASHSWPGGTHPVWRRWVTLAGPDWIFQDGVQIGGNDTPIDDTFCTIVTGAVSVIESEVDFQ